MRPKAEMTIGPRAGERPQSHRSRHERENWMLCIETIPTDPAYGFLHLTKRELRNRLHHPPSELGANSSLVAVLSLRRSQIGICPGHWALPNRGCFLIAARNLSILRSKIRAWVTCLQRSFEFASLVSFLRLRHG